MMVLRDFAPQDETALGRAALAASVSRLRMGFIKLREAPGGDDCWPHLCETMGGDDFN
jgi:hypothetical protein